MCHKQSIEQEFALIDSNSVDSSQIIKSFCILEFSLGFYHFTEVNRKESVFGFHAGHIFWISVPLALIDQCVKLVLSWYFTWPKMLGQHYWGGIIVARAVYKRKYLQLKYAVSRPEKFSIWLNRGSEESLGNDDVLALNHAERSQVTNG